MWRYKETNGVGGVINIRALLLVRGNAVVKKGVLKGGNGSST